MSPALAGVVAAAVAWLAGVRWPGWTAGPARSLSRVVALTLQVASVAGAVLLGLLLDDRVRSATVAWAQPHVDAFGRSLGDGLRGPALTDALWLAVPVCAVVVADGLSPGALHPSRVWRRTATATRGRTWLPALLLLAPLLIGWADVALAMCGVPGQRVLEALGGVGQGGLVARAWPGPGPDPRVPALAWWLAAGVVAVGQARRRGAGRARLWLLVPVVAGLAAGAARPLALAAAAPAFVATAGAATLLTWRAARRDGRGAGAVLPLVERYGVLAILCLALSLRWAPWPPGTVRPLGSDAGGYFAAAQAFHGRVQAEGTNALALAYLSIHPAAREPLFILMLRGLFDVVGELPLHQRYLTMLASVGCVGLTYRFARQTLGRAAGLGAAFMLALVPWHIDFSREGLREEWALLFVYGLALLVVGPSVGGLRRAVLAGALAAAAALTELDAVAVAACLLVVWSVRLRPAWRRAALSWAVFVLLLAPLLLGYRLRTGDTLAPLGASMGGDIRASMTALLEGRLSPLEVLRYVTVGTVEVYRDTVLSGVAAYAGPLAGPALTLALASLVGGGIWLLIRGPRLPVLLALLGAFAPPFTYIAGIAALGGPGSGYTDRYAYLITPATLAVCAWAAWRFVAAAGGRLRPLLTVGRAPQVRIGLSRMRRVSTPPEVAPSMSAIGAAPRPRRA